MKIKQTLTIFLLNNLLSIYIFFIFILILAINDAINHPSDFNDGFKFIDYTLKGCRF